MQIPVHPSGPGKRLARTRIAAGILAMAAVVALGVVLRLADPLASSVVPAEDPYTHMALVREHLRTGDLEPVNAHETLYPPGLHAVLAAFIVLTGADLYEVTLFGPVVLGAIGVLGLGILLWRTAGPIAGFVGALAMAVAPEAIFRTTMMSPTALDLAILPFLLYAILRTLAGRLGWAGVAAPMALFIAFSHPWLLAILCAAGLAFLVLATVLPWTTARGAPLSLLGAALCIAALGGSFGIALTMPTFGFVLPFTAGLALPAIGLAVGAFSLMPAGILLWARRRGWTRSTTHGFAAPLALRIAYSLAIGAALAATWLAAASQGLPEFVDLPKMVGWPILVLAGAALVALPFMASPVANLCAALAAVTLPFVLFNPLQSEFLPHRTVVFLCFALAALAGCFADAAARGGSKVLHALAVAQAARHAAAKPSATRATLPPLPPLPRAPRQAGSSRPLLLATLPALVVTLLLGGSVYAGTPDAYDGGWYRLYNECEMDAFRDIAAQADAHPDALVITGDWQSKLVLSSLVGDASRVGYIAEVFTMDSRRDGLVAQMDKEGRPLVLVVDRHLAAENPGAETAFLHETPWQPVGAWCANMGVPQPRVLAYATEGFA